MSNMYSKDNLNEDVNSFQYQQATIFTATLLFQPLLSTTMYKQLQMIIYKSSVCCFTHMHRHYFIHSIVIHTYQTPP